MRSVVTGAAGFIGSHLVDRLIEDGHDVIGIDNLSTGAKENLLTHLNGDSFRFLEVDVARHEAISSAFDDVNWVFHLAGLADIVPSIEKPLEYHHSNVTGTVSVLKAASDHDVQRFIYAASSSCYGIPDVYPTPETAEIRPQYPYALTKRLGEEYVLHWGKVYDLPVVSLRLFNVFGPRSRTTGAYGAVFGVFLAQKAAGKPFTVVGDGEQSRDFAFVTDVCDAFVEAARSELEGEIFNVGSGGHYTINRLVELLGGEKVHIPERPGEPDMTYADISKIRTELGWKPSVSFEEGVEIMLDHIDDWEDAPVWDEESIDKATESWFKHLGGND